MPNGVYAMRDFAAVRVVGTIDFGVVGLLASLTRALADAGVSVLAFSTFDTDYFLVRTRDWLRAQTALASRSQCSSTSASRSFTSKGFGR